MKMNKAHLYGQILDPPKLFYSGEELYSTMCSLKILRRQGTPGETTRPVKGKLVVDTPLVRTKNPKMMEAMQKLKAGDMISVIGVITTKEIVKKTICPHCGTQNTFNGTAFYVEPIHLEAVKHELSREDGFADLLQNMELSNNVYLSGKLCKAPTERATEKSSICQFQIAVNRRYHIKEDSPDVETDYPYIKSFGEIAKENYSVLHVGSEVFVDGSIQTREYQKAIICASCEQEYSVMDSSGEIVPYYVGYLAECDIPEATTGAEKAEAKAAAEAAKQFEESKAV